MPQSAALIGVLNAFAFVDAERAQRNLRSLQSLLGSEPADHLFQHLISLLPRSADPDMALNNLEHFIRTVTEHHTAADLPTEDERALEMLLQLFGTSQLLADTLSAYPDLLALVRGAQGRQSLPSVAELLHELEGRLAPAQDDSTVLREFRRFRQAQMLRIGINDIIRDLPLEEITLDISNTAEAVIEAATRRARATIAQRFGEAYAGDHLVRLSVLGFGKLGGSELNYSSDIDLMFVYDREGQTRPKRGSGIGTDLFFARVVSEIVRLLSAHTDRGQAYRVDLRLRPEGERGPLARSLPATLAYYDALGRTWERQALIKVRPVAGDRELGAEFLRQIEPFVWRKYLSYAEINEIKALKRRIEKKTAQAGVVERDVKTGRGGIRDIEFTVQFLQLLNGGDLPDLRCRNTLSALRALERVGCLTNLEAQILDEGYRFLRKTEHRLQLLFDMQTHQLPETADELRMLARRMGYDRGSSPSLNRRTERSDRTDSFGIQAQKRSPLDETWPTDIDARSLLVDPFDKFLHDYQSMTDRNRTILNHLLHQTFADSDQQAEPESDLILAPDPDEATIRAVLGRYPFQDIAGAYQNLSQLAMESVPFLSTRRCRHFLASIAPALLRAVAATPDPDHTLRQLEKVSASLGAKAILWELFSFSSPCLKMYVDLCAGSSFLAEILINNPGMIDELLDSLVLNRPREREELRAELAELCRGATDLDPILHSFQDKELLRIGMRDLLGKEQIAATAAALSDVAETLLERVILHREACLWPRVGVPSLMDDSGTVRPCRYVVVALGRLGGSEMTYHSDLDLVMIYEGDGQTTPLVATVPVFTPKENQQAFIELTQGIIRTIGRMGELGRLYSIDMRLRPTGQSGSLVVSLPEFERYFASGEGQVWERQALLRGRVVFGDAVFAEQVTKALRDAALGSDSPTHLIREVKAMRSKLLAGASGMSLRRGPGSMIDVEFFVQTLQLCYGKQEPSILQTNVWKGLTALMKAGCLSEADGTALIDAYSFLRMVESRLRLGENRAVSDIPESPEEQTRLARRLGFATKDAFFAEWHRHRAAIERICVMDSGRCRC